MSSLLHIGVDYFYLMDKPAERLERLLMWAACPIAFIPTAPPERPARNSEPTRSSPGYGVGAGAQDRRPGCLLPERGAQERYSQEARVR